MSTHYRETSEQHADQKVQKKGVGLVNLRTGLDQGPGKGPGACQNLYLEQDVLIGSHEQVLFGSNTLCKFPGL